MKNLSLLAPIAALVCAAVVCGAVLLWAPVCAGMLELTNGNMVPMRCTYTAKVELLLALILAVVAVVALVTKRPMTVALVQERRHGLPEHGAVAAHRRRHLRRGHPRRRPAQPRPQTRHGVGHLSRERMRD